jgi:hypothetical protein
LFGEETEVEVGYLARERRAGVAQPYGQLGDSENSSVDIKMGKNSWAVRVGRSERQNVHVSTDHFP